VRLSVGLNPRLRELRALDEPGDAFGDEVAHPTGQWGGQGIEERPIQVRFSDVDLLGHVNNVRYVDYVQDAQTDFMVGVFREAAVDGHVELVVARTELDYLGQMNLRAEPYAVRTRVAAVGRTSVTFDVELCDADRVMARGRIVAVNLDPDGGRPVPVFPHHREIFERRMREAATG